MPKRWITDREEMERLLAAAPVGCLATVDAAGQPYATPLNFLYQDGCVYFHCALTGRKLDNLATEPRVCFAVWELERLVAGDSACRCAARYVSVLCRGAARIVPDGPDKRELLTALTAKYIGHRPVPPDDAACRAVALVEIRVTELTGKRNVD